MLAILNHKGFGNPAVRMSHFKPAEVMHAILVMPCAFASRCQSSRSIANMHHKLSVAKRHTSANRSAQQK